MFIGLQLRQEHGNVKTICLSHIPLLKPQKVTYLTNN